MATICALSLRADEESTCDSFSNTNRVGHYQNPYIEPRATLAACQKTPQDIAKEQFRASCSALNRSQRFSCNSYCPQNINARICSSWSVTDFARATEYAIDKARSNGSCQYGVEQNMLRKYDFYSMLAFREHIKTIPGYRSHIKNLHARLSAQKPRGYRFFRALGLLDPNYVHQLDMAEKLNAEIVKEEALEQRIAKQQQRQAALEAQQRTLQAQQAVRNQQESVRATFENQCDELNRLSDEWACVQDVYQEHDLYDDGRYERRRQALHSVTNDACNYETKSYTISSDAIQLIGNTGNDVETYQASCHRRNKRCAIWPDFRRNHN